MIDGQMNDVVVKSTAQNPVRERLLVLIGQLLGDSQAAGSLSVDASLNEAGISSLKMVNLMLAMEREFDLTIPQRHITPDNFYSLATIEGLLSRLQRITL